jgi:hypothetical protein
MCIVRYRSRFATLIAQQLQLRGTISYSRGKIAIRDRAELEATACDCHHVLDRSHWPSELLWRSALDDDLSLQAERALDDAATNTAPKMGAGTPPLPTPTAHEQRPP